MANFCTSRVARTPWQQVKNTSESSEEEEPDVMAERVGNTTRLVNYHKIPYEVSYPSSIQLPKMQYFLRLLSMLVYHVNLGLGIRG